MPRLLVTYFGPFEGVSYNPCQDAAQGLAQRLAQDTDTELILRELPVEFAGSSTALTQALAETQPDCVISLGVAVGRSRVSLERVAINLDDARIPDNAGSQLADSPIQAQGPAAYFTTLPVRNILAEGQERNLPVELSYTAGTFVCNHVFYELLHATGGQIPAGFIHIPQAQTPQGEGTPANNSVAHADAGGVEGVEVPVLPLASIVDVLEVAARQTLAATGA